MNIKLGRGFVCSLLRASVSGDPDGAHPGSHGRLERIALFARQAMLVVGSIDVEMPVY